ncbi:MAG: hypothetical protein IJR88_01165 [Clostridia bacterium]|nr:hypothetical protein [Clostridia bacterium]
MNTKRNGNPGKRLLGFFHIINLLPVVLIGEYFFYKDYPSIYLPFCCGYRSTEKIEIQREKIVAENLYKYRESDLIKSSALFSFTQHFFLNPLIFGIATSNIRLLAFLGAFVAPAERQINNSEVNPR